MWGRGKQIYGVGDWLAGVPGNTEIWEEQLVWNYRGIMNFRKFESWFYYLLAL